ncbi:hypothetical protein E3N88_09312 [Mikania micrantha]|uniref:Uncharacterized protein n=1 Tax=Mikania micrantha TaxID=192012 RepID=A0A5N6PKX5_9ASTR|nr:hypothetical protein E3N88_09312 [Mikania micrantha]
MTMMSIMNLSCNDFDLLPVAQEDGQVKLQGLHKVIIAQDCDIMRVELWIRKEKKEEAISLRFLALSRVWKIGLGLEEKERKKRCYEG